jgi:hypothetical protein
MATALITIVGVLVVVIMIWFAIRDIKPPKD